VSVGDGVSGETVSVSPVVPPEEQPAARRERERRAIRLVFFMALLKLGNGDRGGRTDF
jgi:hypothetical protein